MSSKFAKGKMTTEKLSAFTKQVKVCFQMMERLTRSNPATLYVLVTVLRTLKGSLDGIQLTEFLDSKDIAAGPRVQLLCGQTFFLLTKG